MTQQHIPPSSPPPVNTGLPAGWKSEWSPEHQHVYYLNTMTGESTWTLPTPVDPVQRVQSVRRKPIAQPSPHAPIQMGNHVHEQAEKEVTTTNVAQFSSFSLESQQVPSPNLENDRRFSQGYPSVPTNPANPAYHHPQQTGLPTPPAVQYQPPQSPLHYISPGGLSPSIFQPASKPASQYAPTPAPGSFPPTPQSFSSPPASNSPQQYFPPTPAPVAFPPPQQESTLRHVAHHPQPQYQSPLTNKRAFYPSPPNSNQQQMHFPPPPGQPTAALSQFSSLPHTSPQLHQQNKSAHPIPNFQQYSSPPTPGTYQPPQNNNFGQPNPLSKPQTQKPSIGMMGKIGSKFGQLQKTVAPGSTASPLKKWGTRAALGIGAVGALTLGIDGMDGSIFDGASGMDAGAGFDVSGSDMADASAAQSAVDASFAQVAMEQQGRENALMLLDPVGTEYTMVNDNSLI